jgi:hypothetical protein
VDFLKKQPHHAVCCVVLNLLSQVGIRLHSVALAEAYRVAVIDEESPIKSVGSKPVLQHHEHSRALFLYHIWEGLSRLKLITRSTLLDSNFLVQYTE